MAKKKTRRATQGVLMFSGFILMTLSYLVYKFNNVWPYLNEVHSEVFGVGAALFAIGIIWLLFKVKVD